MGDLQRGRKIIERSTFHAERRTGATATITLALAPWFEQLRGDAEATLRRSEPLARVSQASEPSGLFPAHSDLLRLGPCSPWRSQSGLGGVPPRPGQSLQKSRMGLPIYRGLLAELVSDHAADALALIDDALRLAEQSDQRWTDSHLYRIRGDILLKAEPETPRRAESAYRAAIAVAKEQGARSN